jgi:chitodextrinase
MSSKRLAVCLTVVAAMAGAYEYSLAPPSRAAVNLLQNPSLESGSGNPPTCWSLGGYGTNSYTWSRTSDAHSGTYAESLTISNWSGGDRKLVSSQDAGTCAPAAKPGDTYTVTAWYKSPSGATGTPRFYAYYRNSSGSWVYWSQSASLASASTWTEASWTTRAIPSGATSLSVGLGLNNVGSVTMDDFSLVDNGSATPIDTTPPTTPASLAASPGDRQVALSWSASSDNVGVSGYRVYRDGVQTAQTTGTSYTDTGLTDGATYSYTVEAFDAAGNHSAQSSAVSATPMAPPSPTGTYFTTLPSGSSGLPQSDFACASRVGAAGFEPRLDNYLANTTLPAGAVPWSNDIGQTFWTKWIAERNQVTGNFTGTTDQIFKWAACKWGIDENLLRAVAVQESDWHQNTEGDYANGCYHSFGIMQVKDSERAACPLNHGDWGGYPDTAHETALNVDFYSAYIRSCFDGDFYDGGTWLYGGQTIAQVIAASGSDYALWGCVGSWYSGSWYNSGAQSYISLVKQWLAAKTWLGYSTTGSARDITPPTVPTGLGGSGGGNHVKLSWLPSTDDGSVAGYRIYQNGTLIATSTSTSYTATGLTSGAAYTYSVAAVDNSGNQSAHCQAINVTA